MNDETITTILTNLVKRAQCKPGWSFSLDDDGGTHWTLIIKVMGPDARGEDLQGVRHYFPVPWATYNEQTWRRWLFERCLKVERHELGEWFRIDDFRPFAPMHAPGYSPYDNYEVVSEQQANTDQLGNITGNIRARPEGNAHYNDPGKGCTSSDE